MLANNTNSHVNAVAPTNLISVSFHQSLKDCKTHPCSILFYPSLDLQSPAHNTLMNRLFWQYQQYNDEICCVSKASSTICQLFQSTARSSRLALNFGNPAVEGGEKRKDDIPHTLLNSLENSTVKISVMCHWVSSWLKLIKIFWNTPNYNILFSTFWFVAIKKHSK